MKKVTVKFKKPTKLEQRQSLNMHRNSQVAGKKRVSPKSPTLTSLFSQKKKSEWIPFPILL